MIDQTQKLFWIKIKDEFWQSQEFKYLMHQKNGAEFVVIYEMMCSKFKRTEGKLAYTLNNIYMRYDLDMLQSEFAEFFQPDTITVAISLFLNIGLLEQTLDGAMQITNYGEIIGSETVAAALKRRQRAKLCGYVDNSPSCQGGQTGGQLGGQTGGHCPPQENLSNNNTYCEGVDKRVDIVQPKQYPYPNELTKKIKNNEKIAQVYARVSDPEKITLLDFIIMCIAEQTLAQKTIHGVTADEYRKHLETEFDDNELVLLANRLMSSNLPISDSKYYILVIVADEYILKRRAQ